MVLLSCPRDLPGKGAAFPLSDAGFSHLFEVNGAGGPRYCQVGMCDRRQTVSFIAMPILNWHLGTCCHPAQKICLFHCSALYLTHLIRFSSSVSGFETQEGSCGSEIPYISCVEVLAYRIRCSRISKYICRKPADRSVICGLGL